MEEISKMGYFPTSLINEKNEEGEGKRKAFSYSLPLVGEIYQHNLFTKEGEEVLDYTIKERGVRRDLINLFSLGCSINNRQISSLLFEQNSDNFSSDELLSSNLVKIIDDGKRIAEKWRQHRLSHAFGERPRGDSFSAQVIRVKNILWIPDGIGVGANVFKKENFIEEQEIVVNKNSNKSNESDAQPQGFFPRPREKAG